MQVLVQMVDIIWKQRTNTVRNPGRSLFLYRRNINVCLRKEYYDNFFFHFHSNKFYLSLWSSGMWLRVVW